MQGINVGRDIRFSILIALETAAATAVPATAATRLSDGAIGGCLLGNG